MLAPDETAPELALPTIDLRSAARRVVLPAIGTGIAVATLALAGGRIQAVADALRHAFEAQPGWAGVGILLECASLAGYVWLLSLVAGRASARVGVRESAQITLAGAAATRLLPTAGAGGAALTLWALRRSGLSTRAATRTLLAFLVVLYSMFLVAILLAGGVLTIGLVHARGPLVLAGAPALAALIALSLGVWVGASLGAAPGRLGRVRGAAALGEAIREAWALVRGGSPRLMGAIAYWGFDAAVLWAMLRTVGATAPVPIVALAYFVGQVSNTLPLPGAVSGGMTGVLVAFGLPLDVALPSVLAYRTVAVWLPLPVAIVLLPRLRATVAGWEREDDGASAATAAATLGGRAAGAVERSRRLARRTVMVDGGTAWDATHIYPQFHPRPAASTGRGPGGHTRPATPARPHPPGHTRPATPARPHPPGC